VTPLQMADLMAAIANNGTVYRPRLAKDIEDRNGNVIRAIPTETLRTVTFDDKWMPDLKDAMVNVIDNGTATVVHRDDMKIAAKTGTAQVGSKEKPRQIAWLSGYLPADNPQYSFSIMIEGEFSDNHGMGLEDGLLGGREAGAIAKDIFAKIYPPPPKSDKDATAADDSTKKTDETATTDNATTIPAKVSAPAPGEAPPSVAIPPTGPNTTTP
jgi:cell division protein FtsI/penicillin-binding protein 2